MSFINFVAKASSVANEIRSAGGHAVRYKKQKNILMSFLKAHLILKSP